jgi:hypothetical protein
LVSSAVLADTAKHSVFIELGDLDPTTWSPALNVVKHIQDAHKNAG